NDSTVLSEQGKTVMMEFYDNRGYLYTAQFVIKPVYDTSTPPVMQKGQYDMALTNIIDGATNEPIAADANALNDMFTLQYLGAADGNGNRTSAGNAQKNADNEQFIRLNYSLRDGTWLGDASGVAANPFDHIRLAVNRAAMNQPVTDAAGGNPSTSVDARSFDDIDFDLSTTTNVNTNESSTIRASKGDLQKNGTGRMVGEMNGITVERNGRISATYTNGQSKLLGQIATAEFANASGLEKQGDNLYAATMNSGDPVIQDITTDGGYMNTGVLEMSNVDLSQEFTEMITTQRGFQANSRIITVSDTMLEELTNLKR
ncbi:MAG: flagellar hook-basal body complex protein, partial [Lachnospiraceae bacterium]|nr:flagellar hook-basal body complex protein [Lachnospiraceae bacterium]